MWIEVHQIMSVMLIYCEVEFGCCSNRLKNKTNFQSNNTFIWYRVDTWNEYSMGEALPDNISVDHHVTLTL